MFGFACDECSQPLEYSSSDYSMHRNATANKAVGSPLFFSTEDVLVNEQMRFVISQVRHNNNKKELLIIIFNAAFLT